MEVKSLQFKPRAAEALHNPQLQTALRRLQSRFVEARARALAGLDRAAAIRDAAAEIRASVLRELDVYLERFEANASARGAVVYWARDAGEANALVAQIAARHGVRTAVKSKSMVTEECGLNAALARAGVRVWETDLGEYILQLANEPPSHIVAPVVHKSKDEIADLFTDRHRTPRKTDIAALTREAREILRPAFLAADMGISGANFLIAETGSALIVTNEGNGRLATTLPRVHVAITGIEKVVPTLDDAATLLRLLPRSATGQDITNYVSLLTGTKGAQDADGPEHCYIILLDNGRSELLGTELESMLRCIRCGACLNHCPIYQNVGGHAYGWVYPGPMGAVLTPVLAGLDRATDLPNASTFCGQCAEVCPVKIPLPDLLRSLRTRQVRERLRPTGERWALRLWAFLAQRPRLYAAVTALVAQLLHRAAGRRGRLHWLPGAGAWMRVRDLPAPTGETFRAWYARRAAR
jgi:L-lactate dehydrogenase complex protein LldF